MAEKTKGRPKDAKNAERGQVVILPQCPHCKSTQRERYRLVTVIQHGGITAAGVEYTHTIKRRTKCRDCGRTRIDTFLENAVPEASPGDENEPE